MEIQGFHNTLYGFFLSGLHFSNINDGAFDIEDNRAVIQKKFGFLNRLDKNHLIIVSDIDIENEADSFIADMLATVQCRIVFITQNSAEAYRDIFPVIDVGRMKTDYLTELFFHYYNRDSRMEKEAILPALYNFFDDIGGHTKTVEIAASVLSKEMRANTDDLIRYLSSESNRKRALYDRITEKLSNLISMEKFDEPIKKTLLLISFSANPIIEEDELFRLMELCGLDQRWTLTELDLHRWVSYNPENRTVYIEPIIANICVASLLSDYTIPMILFQNTICNRYKQFGSMDFITGLHFLSNMEHFFRLLRMDQAANLINSYRTIIELPKHCELDFEKPTQASKDFREWYQSLRSSAEHLQSEREIFFLGVAFWIQLNILPP